MTLTEEHISEIAGWLDCGVICYFHRPSGTVEWHADPLDPYFEPEPWQEVMDKIENDREHYDRFEKMNSREAYKVMEDFAFALADTRFRARILDKLANRKPFQNFKMLIDASDYREDWFDFKKRAYIDYVKRQISVKQ